MPKIEQTSTLPTRKLLAMLISGLLTALVTSTTLDWDAATISSISLGLGGLIAYYVPPAPSDQIEEVSDA